MKTRINSAILTLALVSPLSTLAAEDVANSPSYFSNPVFNILLGVIILLGILILVLGRALRNTIDSEYFTGQLKKQKTNSPARTSAVLVLFTLVSGSMYGQEGSAVPAHIGGLDQLTFYSMVALIILEVGILLFLVITFRTVVSTGVEKKAVQAPAAAKAFQPLIHKLTDSVPLEREKDILLDHDYDGIHELDNNLPPWWKWGFYVTIVVAVAYMINYHVAGLSPLQADEYKQSVAQAEKEVAEYMKTSANNVDENSVKLFTEPEKLAAGKDLFISNCAACHGRAGEGGVGPNLTDDYWMHSGSLKDVFVSIKYGWPDKGMKAWKDDFSPMQIAEITSFIKSLQGTNPPNAKEKQGDLYKDAAAPADSSQVLTSQLVQ